MHASELAKNHPATNAGIFLGNILGTAGAYALANSLPKWFSQKNQPLQVNPMSPDRAGKIIFGETPSQMTSEAMNGYTPPPDNLSQNYNFDLKNYFGSKTTPQSIFSDAAHNIYPKWQPQSYNDLIQKNGNGLQSTYGDNPFSKNPAGWTFSWFNRGR